MRSRPDLPRTAHAVFEGGQLLGADRTAGVQAAGGDADLGAEAELAAVGELGRGVVQDDGGIDLVQEFFRRRARPRSRSQSVWCEPKRSICPIASSTPSTTLAAMMASRYSVDQSSSLAAFTRGSTALRLLVAAHLAAGIEQHRDQRLEMRRRRRAIDQQRLGRAADAGAPHLGVEQDGLGHVELGRPVDVDVADALEMREHRHPRLRLHARDQALAAARHDDVDRAVEAREHHPDRGALARRHQRDGGLRQGGRAQCPRPARRGSPGSSGGCPSRRAGSPRCRP